MCCRWRRRRIRRPSSSATAARSCWRSIRRLAAPLIQLLCADILGLTLGEARVAAQVGAGFTPREAAEKLGITEETARTALKHVFSKTGVSRQSELVALLSKMLLH